MFEFLVLCYIYIYCNVNTYKDIAIHIKIIISKNEKDIFVACFNRDHAKTISIHNLVCVNECCCDH